MHVESYDALEISFYYSFIGIKRITTYIFETTCDFFFHSKASQAFPSKLSLVSNSET
jgi:hypothetical protein